MAVSTLNICLQILGGLAIAIAVYMATLFILRQDSIVVYGNQVGQSEKTVVLDGWVLAAAYKDRRYITNNPALPNYVRIPKSINRQEGSQFSYSFWLNIADTTPANVANKVLLLKGDPTPYTVTAKQAIGSVPSLANDPKLYSSTGPLIKCPMIRFGKTFSDVVIEINTVKDVAYSLSVSGDRSAHSPAGRMNLTSLLPGGWYMITLTVEDNYAPGLPENGIRVRFFINDTLYREETGSSNPTLRNNAVKQNDAPLWLFPGSSISGTRMANLAYFNRALNDMEVQSLFAAGFKDSPVQEGIGSTNYPSMLTAGNKIDILNA